MIEELMEYLKKYNFKITFAESCTGGALAKEFVKHSGASNYLDESYVTYANESKIKLLNVKKETIDKYGVVSENVTYEMCVGAAKSANAQISIATSGIAGPSDDMGLVCFGFYINGKTVTKTSRYELENRIDVIDYAVADAYLTLLDLMKKLLK